MTPAETYTQTIIQAARQAIREDPRLAGTIIRKTIEILLHAAEGMRQLAVEMDEWTPEPIVEFPNPSSIRRQALDHVAQDALKVLQKEYREYPGRICEECANRAAPSLNEAILAVMTEYIPGPAILLAGEVASSEHHQLALEALDELPQEEMRALRQAAVRHTAGEEDNQDE